MDGGVEGGVQYVCEFDLIGDKISLPNAASLPDGILLNIALPLTDSCTETVQPVPQPLGLMRVTTGATETLPLTDQFSQALAHP